MTELTLSTPSILFSAISLILLAYTNRFLSYAQVVRNLKADHDKNPSAITRLQLANLRRRLFQLKKGADRPVCSFFAVPHRRCVLNCFKVCGCKGSRCGENRRERAYFVMSERANWRVI